METMRATWTDERLDDLARRLDKGFDRIDVRFESMQRMTFGMLATIVAGFLVTNL